MAAHSRSGRGLGGPALHDGRECDTSDPDTGADSCDYVPGGIDDVLLTEG